MQCLIFFGKAVNCAFMPFTSLTLWLIIYLRMLSCGAFCFKDQAMQRSHSFGKKLDNVLLYFEIQYFCK